MKESKFKELFAPTVVLVTICLIASLLLAATYQITAPLIEQITIERAKAARSELIPEATDFTEVKATLLEGVDEVYEADGDLGYVITSHSKGFGGTVTVMTAIDKEGTIINVKVTSASDETPGLGSKATVPAHTQQFIGAAEITSDGEDASGATVINAVTGASYTSRAVFTSVSLALEQYAQIGGAQ